MSWTNQMTARKRRPRLTGFIRERGDSRSMVVTIGGKQYSEAVSVRTLREAQALLPAFVTKVQSGLYAATKAAARSKREAPTFDAYVAEFLANHTKMGADGDATRRAYRNSLDKVRTEIGDRCLSDITGEMLQKCLRNLCKYGRKTARADGTRSLSIAATKLIYAALSVLFSKAVEDKIIANSPVPKFAKFKLGDEPKAADRVRRVAMSAGQITALIQACDRDNQVRLWVETMAATAARPGEALALRWCDIDIANRVMHIRHSVKRSAIRGQGRLGAPKTRGSVRDVPIGSSLAASFEREQVNQEALLRKIFGLPENITSVRTLLPPEDCIFAADLVNLRKVPCSLSGMSSRFKTACRKAGLSAGATPHQLRHSAITAMIAGSAKRRGISVIDAARLAGHSDPGTTSRVYAHALEANLRRGADLADDLIAGSTVEDEERRQNAVARSSDM
jgi:integrase